MINRPNDIPNYLDLVADLEEFGLSKYESMAYITLVSKGTLGASEIAYYSNLPRTKIYTTLKKLERKKLSTISSQKPMIATATPPDEAFGELIKMQQGRLASMYNILTSLKKLKDDGKKPYEEKKYLVLEPNAVVQKIEELISSTKSNIDFILDSWGQNVVFQSKDSLSEAIKRNVKINILLNTQSFSNDNDLVFPAGIEIRSDKVCGNIIIFDFKKIIFIDSTNGKASLILTPDAFGDSHIKLFDEKWKKALRINPSILRNRIPKEAIILSKLVEDDLTQILLDLSIKPDGNYSLLVDQIEKFSGEIKCESIDDIVHVVDLALKISYSGNLDYEPQNNMLKLQFDSKEKSIVPWILIITAYIKKFGNDCKIIDDLSEKNTNSVYIKILNPNVIHVNKLFK